MTDHNCALDYAERSLRELVEAGATNKVLKREQLSDTVVLLEVENPLIARSARPGQFVVVRATSEGERIPLTISESDRSRGTITIIFQIVGASTIELSKIKEGECVMDVCGPLGRPSEIQKFGTVVCVGGGVGIAVLRPIAKALKEAGNTVLTILGAREKSLLMLEKQMREVSDELFITTDDGSYERKGLVTDVLNELIDSGRKIDYVVAIGPMPMMRAVSNVTKPREINTMVSLDPIMIDGTGMCGGCRVTVGGKTMFTCVDGPDFDAHLVDWDELRIRKSYYRTEEQVLRDKAAEGGN